MSPFLAKHKLLEGKLTMSIQQSVKSRFYFRLLIKILVSVIKFVLVKQASNPVGRQLGPP